MSLGRDGVATRKRGDPCADPDIGQEKPRGKTSHCESREPRTAVNENMASA
jgi:hypothetical protein